MTLRSSLIRLASDHPELRGHLLPLLTAAKGKLAPLSKEHKDLLTALVKAHEDLLAADEEGTDDEARYMEKEEDKALRAADEGGLVEALKPHGWEGRLNSDYSLLGDLYLKLT